MRITGYAKWMLVIGALIFFCTTAESNERFKSKDTDGNGEISLEEFKAGCKGNRAEMAEKIFKKLDKDNNGILTKDEAPKRGRHGPGKGAGALFSKKDTDNSGGLSLDEFLEDCRMDQEKAIELYGKLDTDNDHNLTPEELRAGHKQRMKDMKAKREAMLKECDADNDGKYTLEEFKALHAKIAEQHFKRLDKDQDGYVPLYQINAGRGRHHRHGPGRGNRPCNGKDSKEGRGSGRSRGDRRGPPPPEAEK